MDWIIFYITFNFHQGTLYYRCVLIKRVSEATVRVTPTSEMDTARLISVN